MKKRTKNYEMDMCSGPLLPKLLVFALPVMLSGILQLLYNAVDIVVVGQYVGSVALAAVGSTGSLVSLIVNVFMGLSVGASVMVAQYYGAGNRLQVKDTVQTAMTVAGIGGIAVGIFGVVMAEPLLRLMGSPDDVRPLAALYLRIYFCGMPGFMLYNFGAAVLRSVGDTRRPLYFLTFSGILNVGLNLVFILVFHMGVAGVALATIISQYVSAALVLLCMVRSEGATHLDIRHLYIKKTCMLDILRVGLPAGLQSSLFSIANVLIQSSINSFGSVAMAGNAAAANLEGFLYTSVNSIYQAAVTFTGQNVGARQYKRINRILGLCVVIVCVVGVIGGWGAYLLSPWLLKLYSVDPAVIEFGMGRMQIIGTAYFACGLLEVLVGVMRGMGYSILPMVVSLAGACGLRIVWIYTVFAAAPTLETLYWSYPVSWLVTAGTHFVCYLVGKQRLLRKAAAEQPPAQKDAAV